MAQNPKVKRSLNKIASILTARPKMVGQLSDISLDQVPLYQSNPGLSVTVRNEQRRRATKSAADSSLSYRTPRKKPSN